MEVTEHCSQCYRALLYIGMEQCSLWYRALLYMVRSTAYPEATDAHVTPWGLARPKVLTRSSAALPVRSNLKVEEVWKRKESLPSSQAIIYKGISEENVEVEVNLHKNTLTKSWINQK